MQNLIKLVFIVSFPVIGWNQIAFYKIFSNNSSEFGQGIAQLEDSSYIVTGTSSSFNEEDGAEVFLLKLDSLGNFKWSNHYGGIETDWGRRVLYSPNDAFYVAGYTNSIGNGGFDFYLLKTDLNGNQLWEKSFGGTGWEKVNDAVILPDTSILMVGSTTTESEGGNDIFLVYADKDGNFLWEKKIGTPGEDFATSVRVLNDSICIVGGQTYNEDSTLNKGFLLKIKMDGEIEWFNEYGDNGHYCINDLCLVGDHINFVGENLDTNTLSTNPVRGRIFLDGSESYVFDGSIDNYYYTHTLVSTFSQTDKLYIASNFIHLATPPNTYPIGVDFSIARYTETLLWNSMQLSVSNTGDDIGGQLIPTSDGGLVLVGYNTIMHEDFEAGGNNAYVVKIGPNEEYPDTYDPQTYNSLVGISEQPLEEKFKLYPNPVQNELILETPLNWDGKISLCDIYGRSLLSVEDHQKLISLSEFSNGNYLLIFENNADRVVHKLIIQH